MVRGVDRGIVGRGVDMEIVGRGAMEGWWLGE